MRRQERRWEDKTREEKRREEKRWEDKREGIKIENEIKWEEKREEINVACIPSHYWSLRVCQTVQTSVPLETKIFLMKICG